MTLEKVQYFASNYSSFETDIETFSYDKYNKQFVVGSESQVFAFFDFNHDTGALSFRKTIKIDIGGTEHAKMAFSQGFTYIAFSLTSSEDFFGNSVPSDSGLYVRFTGHIDDHIDGPWRVLDYTNHEDFGNWADSFEDGDNTFTTETFTFSSWFDPAGSNVDINGQADFFSSDENEISNWTSPYPVICDPIVGSVTVRKDFDQLLSAADLACSSATIANIDTLHSIDGSDSSSFSLSGGKLQYTYSEDGQFDVVTLNMTADLGGCSDINMLVTVFLTEYCYLPNC